MNIITDIAEAQRGISESGQVADTIVMDARLFDWRYPYRKRGTNRMKKRSRFRAKKRAEVLNWMLDNPPAIA